MKTKKLLIGIIILYVGLFQISCSKEPIRGCTNSLADNYNSSADEDNGSCTYSADLVLFLSKKTSDLLKSVSVTTAKFYVNDSYVGSLNTSSGARTTDPDCGTTTNVLKKTITSKESAITFVFKTMDEDGDTWVQGQTMPVLNLKSSKKCNIYFW
jgi:hypothetical protein